MADDYDTHICLSCHRAIIGLENYVQHKRQECPAKKSSPKRRVTLPSIETFGQPGNPPLSESPNLIFLEHVEPGDFSAADSHSNFPHPNGESNSEKTPADALQPTENPSKITDESPVASFDQGQPELVSSGTLSYTQTAVVPSSEDLLHFPNQNLTSTQSQAGATSNASLSVVVNSNVSVPSIVSSGSPFSPTSTGVIVDPNLVLCETSTASHNPTSSAIETNASAIDLQQSRAILDFFSSLELQLRPTALDQDAAGTTQQAQHTDDPDVEDNAHSRNSQALSKHGEQHRNLFSLSFDNLDQGKESLFDSSKTSLKFATILNDLHLDSDSEGFDMPSDAEQLLNFSDEDYVDDDEEGGGHAHTGGKWKPGHGVAAHTRGKWKPSGKDSPRKHTSKGKMHYTGGKWRSHGKGKGQKHFQDDGSEEEEEFMADSTAGATPVRTGKDCIEADRGGIGGRGKWKSIGKRCFEGNTSPEKDEAEMEVAGETEAKGSDGKHNGAVTSRAVQDKESREVGDNSGEENHRKTVEPREGDRGVEAEETDRQVEGSISEKMPAEKGNISDPGNALLKGSDVDSGIRQAGKSSKLLSMRNLLEESKKKKSSRKPFEANCPLCQKSFNNKYNFIRHLLSGYHIRRAKYGGPKFLLDEGMQRLLLQLSPYQCRICRFFCNEEQPLLDHCLTKQHKERSKKLLGPLFCVRCRVSTKSDAVMTRHLQTGDHLRQVADSGRPCVIREMKINLTCMECPNRVFLSAAVLKKHLKTHQGAARKRRGRPPGKNRVRVASICNHCGKDLKTLYNLAVHIRRRHSQEKPFHCQTCEVSFADRSGLNLHYKSNKHLKKLIKLGDQSIAALSQSDWVSSDNLDSTSTGKPGRMYKCDHCCFVTSEHKALRPHYMTYHTQSTFQCDVCGLTFLKERHYVTHMAGRSHKQKARDQEDAPDASLSCNVCGVKFYNQGKLRLHLLTHGTTAASSQSLGDTEIHEQFKAVIQQMKSEKKRKQFKCPECDRMLKRANLMPHIRMHCKSFPYKCTLCSQGFTSSSSLYRHVKAHLCLKTFVCSHCSKEFIRESALQNHILRYHPEKEGALDNTFLCPICGDRYVRRWMLENHINRKHDAAVKRHKCPQEGCHRSFMAKSELESHFRCHTNERPYLCDLCGYASKTKQMLSRHRHSHTGERNYQCEYCTFRTSHSWGLRRHMRCHIGTRPYKCPHCPYTCNVIENLKKHILTTKSHAGRYMYNCRTCAFGTNTASEYSNHMMGVHNVSDRDLICISSHAGIYTKAEDHRDVPEGGQVRQVREKSHSQKKRSKAPPHVAVADNHQRSYSVGSQPSRSTLNIETEHVPQYAPWPESEVVVPHQIQAAAAAVGAAGYVEAAHVKSEEEPADYPKQEHMLPMDMVVMDFNQGLPNISNVPHRNPIQLFPFPSYNVMQPSTESRIT